MALTGSVAIDSKVYTDLSSAGVPDDSVIQPHGTDVSIIVAASIPAATAVGLIYRDRCPARDGLLPKCVTASSEKYWARALNPRAGVDTAVKYGTPQ